MFEGILQNVPYSGNLSIAYIAQRTAVSFSGCTLYSLTSVA